MKIIISKLIFLLLPIALTLKTMLNVMNCVGFEVQFSVSVSRLKLKILKKKVKFDSSFML